MESSFSNCDEQQQEHELGRFSSLAVHQSPTMHEWNPSFNLSNNDYYNHYMNEILPNSNELFTSKNANFQDMGYKSLAANQPTNIGIIQNADDQNDHDNLWLGSTREYNYSNVQSWTGVISPDASSSSINNYVFNPRNIGLAIDFMNNNGESYNQYSKENNRISSRYDQISSYNSPPSRNSNKRVSTSSLRKPSYEAAKKPRAAYSESSCSLPKVRKEKIGDRIAALHRLVAPFGKTDTTSVLTEAIGYIQFLQEQIQTLSMSCIKPSHSNPHLSFQWDSRKVDENESESIQELRSIGLCLVPLSFASYISSSCAGLGGFP